METLRSFVEMKLLRGTIAFDPEKHLSRPVIAILLDLAVRYSEGNFAGTENSTSQNIRNVFHFLTQKSYSLISEHIHNPSIERGEEWGRDLLHRRTNSFS